MCFRTSAFTNFKHYYKKHYKINQNKLTKMLPNWLNIYRNSKCLRFYCVEVVNTTTLVKTKSQRSSVDKWKTRFYYFILFLKTIHFAYLFAARSKLDDHLRLLHFDSPFLLRTTPTLNFLLFVMSILTLVCLYQLYWFDLTRSLASNPSQIVKAR